jgi:peptide/nickel transport system permease protein
MNLQLAPPSQSGAARLTRGGLRRDGLALASLALIVVFVVAAVLAPFLAPYPDQGRGQPNLSEMLQAPSSTHLLGTDDLGRDLLSRLLFGARPSLSTGFIVVALAVLLGLPLGAVAGFMGGWVDQIIMRATDIFMSFPSLLLAIVISVALGPSLPNSMVAIGLTWWPLYTRLARAQAVSVKQATFIEASRAIGMANRHIILEHVLPHVTTPVLIQATADVGGAILMGAALSFVGLGVQPPDADWGNMLAVARVYFREAAWFAVSPGLAILLVAASFNLVGDAARDSLDPRSLGSR